MSFYLVSSNFSVITSTENINAVFNDFMKTSSVETFTKLVHSCTYYPWLFSLLGSICVGLCGVFPLFIIPIGDGAESLKFGDGAKKLRLLLSFAVGGLLGDVFLHLLPEAWAHTVKHGGVIKVNPSCGLWVLGGMLVFVILEKIFSNVEEISNSTDKEISNDSIHNDLQLQDKNGTIRSLDDTVNNNIKTTVHKDKTGGSETHFISGYLNLAANSIDNFTHGLAIGTSFCISFKLGVFSTFAILVHELPHEVGDFAILLKSGFSRWEAARAQVLTATAGIFGSMVAVIYGVSEAGTSWILPFTAGGFLHIALVSVLPELIQEESRLESAKQLCSLVAGISVMALLIIFFD